ncbi:MAG TPA: serine hydrolase domain-containing protein, partial [Gemmatimonadales bacterium]|nr:serine hydrolase domain-containing protein [Gemmatimonadales bacterium]
LVGCLTLAAHPARARQFERADSIVDSGIRRGIYPGAVLVVGRAAGVLHSRGFGHRTWGEGPVPSPDSSLWDLASLTKVVGTTGAVMRLVEQGRVDLDAPVVRYLPRFRGPGKDRVTVRMLLDHTSGLRSYLPLYRLAPTRDSAITLLYHEPLRRPAGARAEYSDLNFLLLGLLVERVTGQPLDRYVPEAVLAPAGLTRTTYHPSGPPSLTAPTGRYRGTPVCCRVNDQNAARMGGAAGHAGLFSTGMDLARFARLWLDRGRLDGRQVFQSATVDRFLTPDPAAGDRLLGWERANPDHRDDSAYGHLLSPDAFGHTGWTGTLLWIDPDRDLFLVLLTNRAYAPRIGRSIRALRGVRGALADAVVRAVDSIPTAPR